METGYIPVRQRVRVHLPRKLVRRIENDFAMGVDVVRIFREKKNVYRLRYTFGVGYGEDW